MYLYQAQNAIYKISPITAKTGEIDNRIRNNIKSVITKQYI